MAAATDRIGGLVVSSTNPLFLTILAIHVLAALIAVISGAVVALRRDKGSRRHVVIGRWYFRVLIVTAATAVVLAGFAPRRDGVLAVLAVLAAAASTAGVLHRRRGRAGDRGQIIAMGASYTLMLIAFYIDNGKSLPIWRSLPTVGYWLIPGTVGAAITVLAARRHPRSAGAASSWSPGTSSSWEGGSTRPHWSQTPNTPGWTRCPRPVR
jgi:uncharacterized membrane protein